MIKTVDFDGITVEYDDSSLHKWSVMKQIASGTGTFEALDTILCGKSDEVASRLGDSFDKMTSLLERITAIEGNAAKN